MFAATILDHRLAFVFLCALIVGAAVPLAMAWARLLPEDAPPLASKEYSSGSAQENLPDEEAGAKNRDAFAVILLVFVTLSYSLRFPGFPVDTVLHRLSARMPEAWSHWGLLAVRVFLAVAPGLAACYSAFQANFLRVPLIVAGILVLLLWLLEPMLFAAMIAS